MANMRMLQHPTNDLHSSVGSLQCWDWGSAGMCDPTRGVSGVAQQQCFYSLLRGPTHLPQGVSNRGWQQRAHICCIGCPHGSVERCLLGQIKGHSSKHPSWWCCHIKPHDLQQTREAKQQRRRTFCGGGALVAVLHGGSC